MSVGKFSRDVGLPYTDKTSASIRRGCARRRAFLYISIVDLPGVREKGGRWERIRVLSRHFRSWLLPDCRGRWKPNVTRRKARPDCGGAILSIESFLISDERRARVSFLRRAIFLMSAYPSHPQKEALTRIFRIGVQGASASWRLLLCVALYSDTAARCRHTRHTAPLVRQSEFSPRDTRRGRIPVEESDI